jgi:serine acetyltransferase
VRPTSLAATRELRNENGMAALLATRTHENQLIFGTTRLEVWVGGGALILPGVRIDSRAVIGAGSVVTRDIPEGVFAAGNPCRVIRQIPE